MTSRNELNFMKNSNNSNSNSNNNSSNNSNNNSGNNSLNSSSNSSLNSSAGRSYINQWISCFCVVDFDVEEGQSLFLFIYLFISHVKCLIK